MLTLIEERGGRWPPLGVGREVNAWRDDSGRIFARAYVSGSLAWIDCLGVGAFAFSRRSRVVRFHPGPDEHRGPVSDAFGRVLQPVILQAMGFEALHASAVWVSGSVIALAGRRQAGKSTLARAIGRAGHAQFADDSLVLNCSAPEITAHALPFKPRLRPHSADYFGEGDDRASGVLSAPRAPSVAPLGAIVILRPTAQDHGAPAASRLPASAAFPAVLSHAHCFDANDLIERRRMVSAFLTMISRIPVYTLEYRPHFERLPQLIDAVLAVAVAMPSTSLLPAPVS
jgi:hypothetical protein